MSTISSLYETANRKMIEALNAVTAVQNGASLDSSVVNALLGNMLNRVGETLVLKRASALKYPIFQKPVAEFGAFTEYIGTRLSKPIDQIEATNGQVIDEFLVNQPEFVVAYAKDRIKATYLITTQDNRWKDAIDSGNVSRLAQLTALAVQSMSDAVTNHMNQLVPATFGKMYDFIVDANINVEKRVVNIPAYTGDATQYAIQLNSAFRSAIRQLGYISNEYNIMGADVTSAPQDLVLVAFDSPVVSGTNQTAMDIITANLNFGAISRASALQQSLGLGEVYEMEQIGLPSDAVTSFTTTGQNANNPADGLIVNKPNVKFALIDRNALNVGAKSVRSRSTSSARADLDFYYVHMDLEVAFGTGNAIFFVEQPTP